MMRALLTLATAIGIAIATIGMTGANFTGQKQNGGNSLSAKPDWVAPTISLADPGAARRGTVTLTASPADSGSGVASMTIERSSAGANSWTPICTRAAAPWSCDLDTTAGATPDGLYDFRASVTDNAGNSATSTTVANRRIDNTAPASATMNDPGSPLSGSFSFGGSASDGSGSGIASLRFEYRPSSGGIWLTLCTAGSSPFSCTANTTALTDGLYDMQAVATDGAGNTTTSSIRANRRVDNVAPTAEMGTVDAYLRATVPLPATATDPGGIAGVVVQRRPNGGSTWTPVCTAPTSPYSCSLNTAAGATPDGLYDFRAVATDNANRQTASTPVLARRIDNTVPSSVSVTNPGTPITGSKTLGGSATDGGSGLATVAIQYSLSGQNTWTTACSGASSPASCSWNSALVADGLYDFRTLATDRAGNSNTSATASPASRIDNNAPTVSLNDPGAIRGSTTLTAVPSDGDGSGVSSVVIAYKAQASSTWTNLCTRNASPYSCTFNTSGLTDGLYDLRATVSDGAGFTGVATLTRRVDNAVPTSVTLTDPGSPISGLKSYSMNASDGSGSGIANIAVQYSSNGTTWTTVCTASTSPYSCTASSTAIPDGTYSFRAFATDAAGNQAGSTAIASRRVDNTGPTVTMTDPGTNLRGSVSLGATATDPSSVSGVTMQYKTSAGSTWLEACPDTVSPYACNFDVKPLAAGNYDFRAVATDSLGNVSNSTPVTSRRVDNYVQTLATSSCGSTSDVATVPAGGVAAGRTILLRVSLRGAGTGAVSATDSRGNTYTKDADVNEGTARVAVFSAPVTTALQAGDTITTTHPSSAGSSGLVAAELKNIVAAGRVDATGSGTGNSSAPSATVTAATANDFLVGATASANNRTYTEATNWLLLSHLAQSCGGAPGNADGHGASRFTATTGPFTYNPTLSGGSQWAVAVVAYKTN